MKQLNVGDVILWKRTDFVIFVNLSRYQGINGKSVRSHFVFYIIRYFLYMLIINIILIQIYVFGHYPSTCLCLKTDLFI
jgi:hypothetical protein